DARSVQVLSFQKRLQLIVAAMNDFNRDRLSGAFSYADREASQAYRAAAMINEANRALYKIEGLDRPTVKQRIAEHVVMSYIIALLGPNENVAHDDMLGD